MSEQQNNAREAMPEFSKETKQKFAEAEINGTKVSMKDIMLDCREIKIEWLEEDTPEGWSYKIYVGNDKHEDQYKLEKDNSVLLPIWYQKWDILRVEFYDKDWNKVSE